uniref:purine-nucleoside phosphorylase n=1 Tax=Sinocyclocheilus grahami TaxID=75366 RepID=A0A672LW82_SINGR
MTIDCIEMYSHEDCQATADWLRSQTAVHPLVGIVCGSGLGGLADALKDQVAFNYRDIPNFPQSTVHGHAGRLVFGTLKGRPCVCMQGRFHLYEGYPIQKVRAPYNTHILARASPKHVNNTALCHVNSLTLWNAKARTLIAFTPVMFALKLKANICKVQQFVHLMLDQQLKKQHKCTSCVLGMSTVHEVIVARHCGMRVFALSLITNKAVMDYDSEEKANHEEVLQTGKQRFLWSHEKLYLTFFVFA